MIWFNYPQRSYTKQLLCTLHSTYYIYLCRSTSSLRYRTQYRSNRACDAYCCTGYRHDFNGRCIGMCRKIYLIIMNRARPKLFVLITETDRRICREHQRNYYVLSGGVTSTGISISSLRNEGVLPMLNCRAPCWFYRDITEFAKQTVLRELLLGQCCDGLFAIVAVSCMRL